MRALDDALDASQPARHARGAGGLKRRHIEALLALDDHESLRVMSEQHEDRAWQSAREEDGHSVARAVAFLQLIGDDEAAERAERVENLDDTRCAAAAPPSSARGQLVEARGQAHLATEASVAAILPTPQTAVPARDWRLG
ncbi:hypothetical protein [Streptomyces kaempferi]|uniref:hypothetical protein n=1 Tax=Streptomyces kaempferi TaxID=333725 RepID=UPI0036D3C505